MKRHLTHDELETKKIKLYIENNFSDIDIVSHGVVSASVNTTRYLRKGFTSSKFRPGSKLYIWGRLDYNNEDRTTPVESLIPMNINIVKISKSMILTGKVSRVTNILFYS
jgi:hypothetical protein